MFRYIIIFSISIIILGFYFLALFQGKHFWQINRARRRGFNPKNDEPTMFHVRELILNDEKEMAIQLYSQIFQVGRKDAKREVENLEKSIKEKNI